MSFSGRPAQALLAALLLCAAVAPGQSPHAELLMAGLPVPPSPAEVAALSADCRMQQQAALKAVWLERLISAREARHRVSSENLSRSALLASRLGAPPAFVELLRRQASDSLSARERYLLESAQRELLSAYGVDARELRFFVEAGGLSASELRDVGGWLPLPGLFNLRAEGEPARSPQQLRADYVEYLASRRDVAAALAQVADRASADEAAELLRPVLLRYYSALPSVLQLYEEGRGGALSFYSHFSAPVDEALSRERARLQEHGWFGSHRLQVVDYLLR